MKVFLQAIYSELGINAHHLSQSKLLECTQSPLEELEVVEIDYAGRHFILQNTAAQAWRQMSLAANADKIELIPYSGFRSYLYQKQLIKRKLDSGQSLDVILTETAIPGFSEHHSGRAVDICAEGKFYLSEDFEKSDVFAWLVENARGFNFKMSYPRDNVSGIIYEPWHWCFHET